MNTTARASKSEAKPDPKNVDARDKGIRELSGGRFNLDLLVHFEALMRERHVSRAAISLGIGQPAVSSALSRLREVFQDPLLVRTARGMIPTARAMELETHVREIMRTVGLMLSPDSPSDLPEDLSGTVNISAAHGTALIFLPPLMAQLRRETPGIHITVAQRDNRRIAEYLETGECDIALDIMNAPPQLLRCVRLYPQHIRCIVSDRHPTIKRRLSLEEFVKYPHVLWDTEPVKYPVMELLVNNALRKRGLNRTAGVRVASATLAPAIVAATDMIATVSDRLAYESARTLPLIVLEPPVKLGQMDFSMYWHERTHLDPVRAYVRRAINDIAKTLRHSQGKSNPPFPA
jgi:LysR family transcriptional regulator, mexEF-oprN operon transcriptional activator